MNRAQKLEYAALLEEQIKRNKAMRLHKLYAAMYPWQVRFNSETANNRSCALIAANQVGKSLTGVVIDAHHLTGDYPEDWPGHKFEFAPLAWLLGYSAEKTRDLLQTKLFGRLSGQAFEGGLIPADRIVDYKSMSGTSGACREVRVKHASGGISICQFWSYSQGQHALMGDVVDWYHIDEEPEDQEIHPQVMTRTLNGDRGKGGRGIITMTPENGKTPLVCRFMDEGGPGMYLQTATWDDAPHLSAEAKEQILAMYPPYQRDMRSKGTPLMGSGLIFAVDENDLKIAPFAIPDYWFVIDGMDFGWDHPQAHVQLVWDRDADMFYVTNAWKKSNMQPYQAWHIIKPWAKDIPTAWPHDGSQTKQQMGNNDAVQQKAMYEAEGMWMLAEHATFPDGGNGIWAGITFMLDLMQTGRLKIFSNLFELFEEIREYHTKTTANGNVEVVKLKDDLISACFHPDTEIMTDKGLCRIADMAGKDGVVVSLNGELQQYRNCRLTRKDAVVIRLSFSDGHQVVCTPDHKFLTVNGWRDAIHLHGCEIIQVASCQGSFTSTASSTQSGQSITERVASFSTGRYGEPKMEIFQQGIISTTKMATPRTMCLKILSVSWVVSTFQIIIKGTKDTLTLRLLASRFGKKAMQANKLLSKWASRMLTSSIKTVITYASNAEQVFGHRQGLIGSVATSANLSGGGRLDWITSQSRVHTASKTLYPTNMQRPNIAAGSAAHKDSLNPQKGGNTLKVLRIESAGRSDVYCMEVPATQAFALANGAIAHNCRYAIMMRRHAIRIMDIGRNNDYIPSKSKGGAGQYDNF